MFYTWIKCKEKTICNCNKDISLRSGSHRMRPPQMLERMSGEELLWWLGQFGTQDCNWSSQRATSLAWPSLELRWCSHSIEQCAMFSDFERILKRPKNSWNLACAILVDVFFSMCLQDSTFSHCSHASGILGKDLLDCSSSWFRHCLNLIGSFTTS